MSACSGSSAQLCPSLHCPTNRSQVRISKTTKLVWLFNTLTKTAETKSDRTKTSDGDYIRMKMSCVCVFTCAFRSLWGWLHQDEDGAAAVLDVSDVSSPCRVTEWGFSTLPHLQRWEGRPNTTPFVFLSQSSLRRLGCFVLIGWSSVLMF